MLSYYDLLGLAPTADHRAIQARYHALAKVLHPDRTGGQPELARLFGLVRHAYEALGEPGERARYDGFLAGAALAERDRPGGGWRDRMAGAVQRIDEAARWYDQARRHPAAVAPQVLRWIADIFPPLPPAP